MTVVPLSSSDTAIACTLDHREMADRIGDWQAALEGVDRREPVDGGIRLTFGPRADLGEIVRLARDEWTCCSFFAFTLAVSPEGVRFTVTAPPEANGVVTAVFGSATPA